MTRRHWCCLALAVLTPLSLWGQQSAASEAARTPANRPATTTSINDSAGFNAPSPEGLIGARNLLSWGTNFSTGYDDNIAQTNANRMADTAYVISPHLAIRREEGRLAMGLSYRPTLLVYQHQAGYNEQDHDLDFDANFRATDRLRFGLRTNVLYRSGLLDSLSGTAPVSGPVSPGLLNDTIVTPFANQFENNSRADVRYQIGPRAAFEVFTTYMLRSFSQSTASSVPLFETEGGSAGLTYLYQTGPRSTLGLTYLYEMFHAGAATRVGLDVASISWTLAVTPRLKVNVFGGPVHSGVQGSALLALGPSLTLPLPFSHRDWHWAAGGAVTFQTAKNSLRLSASRQVTDGGGLIDAVTNDVVEESFERHLARRWSIEWSAGWQRNTALEAALDPGEAQGEYGRILILHAISSLLTAGAGYQFERQRVGGSIPLGANFDRNFVYFTLVYRFKNIPLGR
ncbi:MAG TPA: hypothetical protein VNJ52_07210 [Patescibacteria group bacterium]|nr:hypothetical protein [Patescibacteria group bacterium]